MNTAAIEIICATRLSEPAFWQRSALGLSLQRLANAGDAIDVSVVVENRRGLPSIYNEHLRQPGPDPVVFIHDDVWIDDSFFVQRLHEALMRFDVVGVAGNRRSLPLQASWAFVDDRFTWDAQEHLSGAVGHGKQPFGAIGRFGPTPAECELLDGLLLAARRSRLAERHVAFDEGFEFHLYDLDFCRTARQAGLTLGTWPIALTHQSGGNFGSEGWRAAAQRFRRKWWPAHVDQVSAGPTDP